MKDLTVNISGTDFKLLPQVFDLIHSISLERDELKSENIRLRAKQTNEDCIEGYNFGFIDGYLKGCKN